MKFVYTRHQVPRGSLPDAEQHGKMYLIKNVLSLRATYQIRLLTYLASEEGKKLVLMVPKECVFHPTLRDLIKSAPGVVKREALPRQGPTED